MSGLLNRSAVSCLNKEEAPELLAELLSTPNCTMVQAHTYAVAVQDRPTGTGAVDPNPLKR